jgi:hypothetical protein
VTYQTDHMLEKNRDFVVAEHQALLAASALPLARALFPDAADAPGAALAAAAAAPAPPAPGGRLRPAIGALRGSSNSLKGSTGSLKGFQFVSVRGRAPGAWAGCMGWVVPAAAAPAAAV